MIEIRKAEVIDAPGISKVHVETWRSAYSHFVPKDYLDALSIEKKQEHWEKVISLGQDTIVAEEGGQIIGFISGGPSQSSEFSNCYEIYTLYILDKYQGQGIGKSLMDAIIVPAKANNFTLAIAWALSEARSCEFYAKLGGKIEAEKPDEIHGKSMLLRAFIFELAILPEIKEGSNKW